MGCGETEADCNAVAGWIWVGEGRKEREECAGEGPGLPLELLFAGNGRYVAQFHSES